MTQTEKERHLDWRYPFMVEPNGVGGYLATCRDVPEAITKASSREELETMAEDALVTAIDFYREDQRPLARPSAPQPGDLVVSLPEAMRNTVVQLTSKGER